MAVRAKSKEAEPITIEVLDRKWIHIRIIGTTPLIFHAMSQKALQELCLPKPRMTDADKAQNLKHDPIAEYRSSVYRWSLPAAPTRLMVPSTMFKACMMSAAIRVKGIAKTETGQLVWVNGDAAVRTSQIAIYGTPQIRMDVVRMSDIGKTPDIRWRATLPEWCCEFDVGYSSPTLTARGVATLLANAGNICGIGDYRHEKGKADYGSFAMIDVNNKNEAAHWDRIVKQAKLAQDEGLANPLCWDDETQTLLDYFNEEISARGRTDQITLADIPQADLPETMAALADDALRPMKKRGNGRVHA